MITLSANQFSIDDAHCTKLAHFFNNFQFLNHCSQVTWVLNASQFSFAAVPILTHDIIFKIRPAAVSSSPLQIFSILYCFFTSNELIWTLDGNQITKMGIQDNALQWRANAKRNIEKYRSRNTGGAKVDKLGAQKWTNWGRNEMCCSCDLK